jgi:hypothetical protein
MAPSVLTCPLGGVSAAQADRIGDGAGLAGLTALAGAMNPLAQGAPPPHRLGLAARCCGRCCQFSPLLSISV